jgi:hypothetical protein
MMVHASVLLLLATVMSPTTLQFAASAAGDGPPFCGQQADGITTPGHVLGLYLDLSCMPGAKIASVGFARYGTSPLGSCGSFKAPSQGCATRNATGIVAAACVGHRTCRLWPNTTTFGDPCLGIKKSLYVQAQCTSGPGTATAGCLSIGGSPCPTPPPLPPAPTVTSARVQWTNTTQVLATAPSLQVVAHALLMRDSPIHDRLFQLLREMKASWVRYVPWLPTPRLGVAELEPPSGTALCMGESVREGSIGAMDCGPTGGYIEEIEFASWGAPAGFCGAYQLNHSCHSASTKATIEHSCLGRQSCAVSTVDLSDNRLESCGGSSTPRRLTVQARCSNHSKQHTYWNFTLLDQQMLDYWDAVGGQDSPQIPNFSTPPTWLYDNASWGYNSVCTSANTCKYRGYEKGSAPASAHGGLSALGDYYGRLLAWYTRGGFHDEYGEFHASGHYLNITIWEIYNEVDYEHGHTPQSYTEDFDAIVAGIRRLADPNKTIAFVGLSLPNIDDEATVVKWAEYFLNASNHAVEARDALQYIGYHAYPTSKFPMHSDNDMSQMFAYVDEFVDRKVQAVQAVVDRLSPHTITLLDESGVTGPLVGGIDAPTFWVAGGSYWAYLWARAAAAQGARVGVVGQSQFMDSPDREPGVSMMDWRNGNGTAKYWINRMVIEEVALGDLFVQTTIDTTKVYAQGFVHVSDGSWRVLLINKQNAESTVTVADAVSARVVDGRSNEGEPRAEALHGGQITLAPFATAIVNVNKHAEH